jgi:site-specific DNA recombinase
MERLAQKRKVSAAAGLALGVALVYARVSTTKQGEEGTSLDSQASACIAHAEKLGYQVGRVTKEVYSGAELFDRPLLSRDRADIRAGVFQAVIVYAIDRLSRQIGHLAIISEECERADAKLIFVMEDLDNSPEGKLLQSVKAYVAEVEREKIKERTLRGKRARLLAGKIHNVGRELYGYRRDKERAVRVIHEPEARVVSQIFQWVALEAAGMQTVTKMLNRAGVPSPWASKGEGQSPWNAKTVRDILRNPNYKGETVVWRYQAVNKTTTLRPDNECIRLPKGVTPAIVTPEMWQRAQERLETNKGEARRNEVRPYLLRGHIVCAECGARMYPIPNGTRERPSRYYRCSMSIRYSSCRALSVPADLCEDWTWEEVKRFLRNPDLIAAETERLQSGGIEPQLIRDREVAQRALERQTRGVQRLVRRLREADDELAAIIERELLQAEREKQQILNTIAELDALIARQEQAAVNLRSLHEYCCDVEQALETFDFAGRRLALEALGAEVVGAGREWKLIANLPFYNVEPVTSCSARCQSRRSGGDVCVRRDEIRV